MKKSLFTLIFAIYTTGVFAQNQYLADEEAVHKLSKSTTDLFFQNNVSSAFDDLSLYWHKSTVDLAKLETKSQKSMAIVVKNFGKALQVVKVNEEKISDFAIRETYIITYEKNAIRLIFDYYKNDKGWVVKYFKWDDRYEEELK